MKTSLFFANLFCWAVFALGNGVVHAAPTAQYHKAGQVGVFSVEFEVPADLDVAAAAFTPRAGNEKAYLLNVQYPKSVTDSWAAALSSEQYDRPDREQIQEELRMLSAARARSAQELQQTTRELEKVRKEAQSGTDGTLLDQADELESQIADQRAQLKELDEQIMALQRKNRESMQEKQDSRPQTPAGPIWMKILGRFRESGPVKIELFARDGSQMQAEVRSIASVELNLPAADIENPALLKEWATVQANKYLYYVLDSPYSSYYQYCLLQSSQKYGLPEMYVAAAFQEREGRERPAPDLYAMTTGALAIQESLQLEEMTGGEGIPIEPAVPVNTLQGPAIKSHPFEKMMQGRTAKIFPVASLIPHDNYYFHFSSISKEIAACDLFRQWGTSLLRAATVSARDADLPARYQDQLCLDLSLLTRLFGDLVIGEIAVTGGDPFLREGSDMAVLIQVKSRKVFDTMTKNYEDKVLKNNPDVKQSESNYRGISIRSIASPDRRIQSHSAYLGDYRVYANSMNTLKRIMDTHAGEGKSMAGSLDFQYMRTIFPGTAQEEDGFLYLSDSFIRKLLSASWKIQAQRRILCQNHLRMISNASMMHKMEMGKSASVSELIQKGYLNQPASQCPDHGTYSLDESGRAFCSVHNCLQYCTPIADVPVEKASQKEAEEYRQFVERYSQYWSRYFDPIGIRFKLGDRIEVQTCILPLIENSIYNQLRDIVGGSPVELNSQVITDGTIVSIGSKFTLDSEMTRGFRSMQQRMFPMLPELNRCLGDNLSIGFYDSDVLFTFSEESMSRFGRWMDLDEQILFGLIASSINLPVYAVLDLQDQAQAETYIRGMLQVARMRASEQGRRGFFDFGIEPYAAGEYKGHKINTVACTLVVIKFRLYYAMVSDRLVISTKRYVLEKVLDAIDGKQTGETANLQVMVQPKAFDKIRPVIRVGWQERMRDACLKNMVPIRALMECHGATEATLNEVSRKTEGVTLRCPSGGRYLYDPDRDLVYCSVHGNSAYPKQPVEVTENEGLLEFLGRMNDFSVNFQFTEEGIMTKVAFDLEPKD